MEVEVILMDNVAGLGGEGEVVKVAGGYARNYLLPRNLAQPVGKAALRRLEKLRAEREEASRVALAEARAKAEKLVRASCTLQARTTADGSSLYGSVSATDIAETISGQYFPVSREQIVLEAPIKEIGTYDVKIRLHQEVEVPCKVWVVDAAK